MKTNIGDINNTFSQQLKQARRERRNIKIFISLAVIGYGLLLAVWFIR